MTLYQIIKSLQSAQGSNAKQAILEANKDNTLLQDYLKATYDPSISFYQKKLPKATLDADRPQTGSPDLLGKAMIEIFVDVLNGRKKTRDEAKKWLADMLGIFDKEGQELVKFMIDRSVGAAVGDTMILKVWPDLYFIPSYMRCGLLDAKAKKLFSEQKQFMVQKKADGCFAYLVVLLQQGKIGFACTRNGSFYPDWLVGHLLSGREFTDVVFVGEMLVYKNGKELSRKEGNGIYNSILKGAEQSEFPEYTFGMEAWDLLPYDDWKKGLCKIEYHSRFIHLERHCDKTPNIKRIETKYVRNLAEAKTTTVKYQREGFEGSIYKTLDHLWKDGTSPYNIKDKIAFEADYEITHVTEGTGKAKGMMGAVGIKSREGKIACDVGTGWSDAQRKEIFDNPPIGGIIAVKANEIISSRGSDTFSLFLPVAIEIRNDKTVADTYEECVAQFEAAKNGE